MFFPRESHCGAERHVMIQVDDVVSECRVRRWGSAVTRNMTEKRGSSAGGEFL
jgi:hypothetical protein